MGFFQCVFFNLFAVETSLRGFVYMLLKPVYVFTLVSRYKFSRL